jgi:DNA-binding CsgD family transcriptional regulator
MTRAYDRCVVAADVRAARERVLEQALRPLPGAWFAEGVMDAVGGAVGFDGYCLFGVDPLSRLRSVMFSRHGLQAPSRRLVENETVEVDVNRYVDLVEGPRHVGVMGPPGAHAPRSPRLHEILRPEGYTSELRLALTSGGRYWGALSLFRDDPRHPFTDRDADAAEDLAHALSTAVRRYQAGRPGAGREPRRAGVVLVDRTGAFRSVSEDARTWLVELADSWVDGATEDDVSRVVLEVAEAARTPGKDPTCRVRMPQGDWLVVSGSRVDDGDVDVAVVLQPGAVGTVAPALAVWCGLTARETGVLALAASGLAAKQMAHRLDLSLLTVNDHLRSIYRKADVHGRDELLSLL